MATLRSWRTLTCFTNDKLNFDNKKKNMDLMGSSSSHRLGRLELVGT